MNIHDVIRHIQAHVKADGISEAEILAAVNRYKWSLTRDHNFPGMDAKMILCTGGGTPDYTTYLSSVLLPAHFKEPIEIKLHLDVTFPAPATYDTFFIVPWTAQTTWVTTNIPTILTSTRWRILTPYNQELLDNARSTDTTVSEWAEPTEPYWYTIGREHWGHEEFGVARYPTEDAYDLTQVGPWETNLYLHLYPHIPAGTHYFITLRYWSYLPPYGGAESLFSEHARRIYPGYKWASDYFTRFFFDGLVQGGMAEIFEMIGKEDRAQYHRMRADALHKKLLNRDAAAKINDRLHVTHGNRVKIR